MNLQERQISGSRESGRAARGPTSSDLLGAALPDFQGDAGVEFLKDNPNRDKVAFARHGFTERAHNGQSVSMRSTVGAPDDRGVGNVLAEKRREVWAVVGIVLSRDDWSFFSKLLGSLGLQA